MASTSAALSAVIQAVRASGGSISEHVRAGSTPYGGRGVYAESASIGGLAKSQMPLAHIPGSLIITAQVAMQSEIVCECLSQCDQATQANESVALALFLLTEQALGAGSKWSWYIDALPQTGTNGLFFDSEDLAALRDTPLAAAVTAKMRQLQRQYDMVASTLQSWEKRKGTRGNLGLEAYKWAHFIVLSRAISIASYMEAETAASGHSGDAKLATFSTGFMHSECDRALVPFLDMFNHSEQPTAFWSFRSDGSAVIFAGCEPDSSGCIDIGDTSFAELHFSYGQNPNTEWAYAHGFLPESNAHDSWPCIFKPSGSDQMVQIKSMWMHELGLLPRILFADPGQDSADSNYLTDSALLTLCLEFLDDTSDECLRQLGCIKPDFPYFKVDGALIDDDTKLLQVPGLRLLALEHCIRRLQHSAQAMKGSLGVSKRPVVNDYLRSQALLLDHVIASLKELTHNFIT
ncbi:hypothetical protein GGI12_000817 [Dipsacomyces acuminosporus]|nr:hypothetical protein GGI12_000817 [Dipsacomyces acuminosporus]